MNTESIFFTFEKIINWASERGKEFSQYGTDKCLYLAEIHAVAIIGDKPGVLQQELCDALGVTKGRISVLISNLVKKGLVERRRNENDKKQFPLYLSDEGKKAYEFHRQKEKKSFNKINSVLKKLTQAEIDKFDQILKEVFEILK